MSRLLHFALFAAATFAAIPAFAQQNNPDAGYGGNAYNYGQDFLYGQQPEQQTTEEQKAQQVWQYGNKYKKSGEGKKEASLIPPGQQVIYFIRTPETASNEATLRLTTPVSITGCMNVVPPIVSVRASGTRLSVKVEDASIALDKSARYSQFECKIGSASASADIKITRDEIEKGIKTITFQSKGGGSDTYNIELNGDKLALIPKKAMAFKPFTGSGKPDPLSYVFYPENTVILYAPGKAQDAELADAIHSLGQSKGLTPMTDQQTPDLKNAAASYFIDQSGGLVSSLAPDANAFFGTVTIAQKFNGPEGEYLRERPVEVYVKRPGMLD